MTEENHKFTIPGIWVPTEILFHDELKINSKILFGFLTTLAKTSNGCWASNRYLSKLINVQPNTITTLLADLKEHGFVDISYSPKNNGTNETIRNIYISDDYHIKYKDQTTIMMDKLIGNSKGVKKRTRGGTTKSLGGVDENSTYNTNNNTNNRTTKTIPKNLLMFVLEFYKIQKENHPNILKKDLTKNQCIAQATQLSNLTRLDKYNFETEIKPAVLWATSDSFWTGNLLSLASLRTKSKSNSLTKFQNILSKYLEGKPKSTLSPERQAAYKKWSEEED